MKLDNPVFVLAFRICTMNVSSDTSGSDSDGLLSADDSISVGSDSDISPSDSSNEDSSELDEREFYLPEHFQDKEEKFILSKWAAQKLRSVFLGKQIIREERKVFLVSISMTL